SGREPSCCRDSRASESSIDGLPCSKRLPETRTWPLMNELVRAAGEVFGASAVGSFLLSLGTCSLVRRFAVRHALVDIPNARSLHQVPVPRLGGVALTGATWLTIVVLTAASGHLPARDFLLWLLASFLVASLGLLDDVRSVRADVRFAMQFA